MLFIHRSNQLEELLRQLAANLSEPQSRVMAPETIIVQSQGMARWLSLQLAEKMCISANLDCAFPAAFIWRLLTAVATEKDALAAYEPDSMLWAIMELLEAKKNHPEFSEIAHYLENDNSGLNRFQLASRLADLFDKYMVYRPDWFQEWPADMSNWQADLWQSMMASYGDTHRIALQERLFSQLGEQSGPIVDLERLSIFGIPALPPSQFAVFVKLAELIDVHLYLLAPCREFWTDFVSAKTLVQARLASGGMDPEADLHFEEGCPLLISMGALGREFQILLQDSEVECHEEDSYVEPGQGTALTILQDDILNGRSPDANSPVASANIADDDHSLMIQVTHSPMREVEILYDQLLNLLTDPSLEPGDILVMTPDINLYAPLIDAVFSNRDDAAIPFAIADGPVSGAVIRGFIDLLEITARAGASEVMALLRYEPLRTRFAIQPEDLATLEAWVSESGIKWGFEQSGQARHGSWLAGLERLLMGYIAGGDGLAQVTPIAPGEILVNNILPCDILEGGDGDLLAKLLDFVGALRRLFDCPPRPLTGWADFFSQVLDDFFFIDEDNLSQAQFIRQQFAALKRSSDASGSVEDIDAEVIKAYLKDKLAGSQGNGNFLSGRVTFCQMSPMRSIPFPVICLLGMNDNDFPRHDRPLSFDLTAKEQRLGDRSRRADDRYLFLETIISARRNLYISYIGLSEHDSRQLPASVLVCELLEHLGRRLDMSSHETAQRFMVWHPLQPFSRRYFMGNLYSYSHANREMAGRLGTNELWTGLGGKFACSGERPRSYTVDLTDFIDFFSHPVRFLLRHRFGVNLEDYYHELEDREPFGLDHLARYKITGKITEINLAGKGVADEILAAGQQRGELPAGETGKFYFEKSLEAANCLTAQLQEFTAEPPLPLEMIQLDLDIFTLAYDRGTTASGGLQNITAAGQFFYRPIAVKSMKYKDYVQGWICHLLISTLRPDLGLKTVFVGLDGKKTWNPLAADEAMQNLRELARVFDAGQYRPLPLYPKSSLAYAKARWAGRKRLEHEAALERAELAWSTGGYYDAPENSDPYFTAAFGNSQLPLMPKEDFNFTNLAELLLAGVV